MLKGLLESDIRFIPLLSVWLIISILLMIPIAVWFRAKDWIKQ